MCVCVYIERVLKKHALNYTNVIYIPWLHRKEKEILTIGDVRKPTAVCRWGEEQCIFPKFICVDLGLNL